MKLFSYAALAGLFLALGGCASIGPGDTSANPAQETPPTAAVSPAYSPPPSPSHQPEYPAGALTPIDSQEPAPRPVAAMTAPTDLWERIRRGFAMSDLESELVPGREQWYAARPAELENMAERSRKYLFHIVEELELRGLPTELALLPFIESAYNPQAYSHARAAGMWQFIPSTGKLYQLKQNAFRDDRRDVLASTQAALDYLERLYGMFGDWHLALASYNWGEGSVGRAIAKNQRSGKGTSYLDLKMPMETRYYIPKLQAMKNIVARPDAFGVKLPVIENHPYFDSVTITRDIDVALAAKLAEVPLEDFKALNPSMHRPVILAAGTPQILLPWDNAAIFQRNLDAYAGTRLSSWTVWIAPTTMKPDEAARRVKMSEADLRYVNRIPPRMLIRAGSTLLVPRPASQVRDVTERIADNGQLHLAREQTARTASGTRRTVLKVGRRGDTVANIAQRYRLPVSAVARWNKVSEKASFKPGDKVVVFM
ncbi:transglycosylase SLT domain-containing protein [Rhodoferax sp. BAB1]|uniref:transglycosylase SLT domain-containing protein n=1 Tax=Rhodoferax sp. BAB1 TaxID=2741720 RepID=UPI001575D3E6|nr:transglycosylase SLT domain-containing protein [Rhodoferax sp. BAB1]QKO21480.1 transglycosylase SLT domain-containing protein [Rhodoferax sp. BAB1]